MKLNPITVRPEIPDGKLAERIMDYILYGEGGQVGAIKRMVKKQRKNDLSK